jgi:hypothetical protein
VENLGSDINTTDSRILWIVTNAISWAIGIAVGFIVELKIHLFLSDISDNVWGISDLFTNLISATVLGVTIGFGQTLVLKHSHRTIEWQWAKSTLLGILIATFLVNVSGSHTFYPMDCFYCFGGINLPSQILDIWPWNSVGGQRFSFGTPITSGLIGLTIGASQYYFHKKQDFLTAWWVIWSTISFELALIGSSIVSIFADDILIVGVTQGVLYGLITARPITRQLQKHHNIPQETQAGIAYR